MVMIQKKTDLRRVTVTQIEGNDAPLEERISGAVELHLGQASHFFK